MKNSELTSYLVVKVWKLSLWDQEQDKDVHFLPLVFNIVVEVLMRAIRWERVRKEKRKKRIKVIHIGRKKQNYLCVWNFWRIICMGMGWVQAQKEKDWPWVDSYWSWLMDTFFSLVLHMFKTLENKDCFKILIVVTLEEVLFKRW